MSNDRICAHKLFNSSNTRADWVTCQLNRLCSNRFNRLEIPDGCDHRNPKSETFIHLVISVCVERFAVCKPSRRIATQREKAISPEYVQWESVNHACLHMVLLLWPLS